MESGLRNFVSKIIDAGRRGKAWVWGVWGTLVGFIKGKEVHFSQSQH